MQKLKLFFKFQWNIVAVTGLWWRSLKWLWNLGHSQVTTLTTIGINLRPDYTTEFLCCKKSHIFNFKKTMFCWRNVGDCNMIPREDLRLIYYFKSKIFFEKIIAKDAFASSNQSIFFYLNFIFTKARFLSVFSLSLIFSNIKMYKE